MSSLHQLSNLRSSTPAPLAAPVEVCSLNRRCTDLSCLTKWTASFAISWSIFFLSLPPCPIFSGCAHSYFSSLKNAGACRSSCRTWQALQEKERRKVFVCTSLRGVRTGRCGKDHVCSGAWLPRTRSWSGQTTTPVMVRGSWTVTDLHGVKVFILFHSQFERTLFL